MKIIFFFKAAIVFIFSFCTYVGSAQVCSGSLGDPVVNVNFGSGSNPGNQLKAATTTYNFTSSTCPDDGYYTVVNNTAGCFNNSWHTVPEDHTPNDINGYMMLVNASFNPGDFYVDTVRNLCANTTYEFAAWVTNVLLSTSCGPNPISPKLIFTVESIAGTVLGTYSTGDISTSGSPTWKQYGLFFTTPINTGDVVIRLTNTAPGGCGNDIALDDITFRPCGPTVTISTGNGQPSDMCTGSVTTVSLTASIGSGYISPSLQWQESLDSGTTWTDIPGQTSVVYLFNKTATGIYKYRLSVAEGANINISNCRVASNPVTITIRNLPVIVATSNSPVCEKSAVNLTATGGATYAWSGPAGFTSTLAAPSFPSGSNSAGLYNLSGTDQYGCINTASVTVIVNPKPIVTVSNTQKICEGDSVMLQAGGGSTFLWSPATGLSAINIANPIARPVDSITYTVIVTNTNTNNCADTATVSVNVLKKPTATAGPDKILLKGQQVMLEGKAGGSNISISWTPVTSLDNPLLIQPSASPLSDIRYTLTVTSNVGCGVATDDMFVKVYNDIYVPNAFSPNNDQLNDTWRIESLVAVPNAKVTVYNRYGAIIFETTGNSLQWDGSFKGSALPAGAYPYMIDLKNGRPLKTGMVMIVR